MECIFTFHSFHYSGGYNMSDIKPIVEKSTKKAKTSKVRSVLKNKPFALLWTGQSVSLFGLSIYSTSLPFLVFYAGGSAMDLSLAQSFFIIPQLFFLLISGVLVDRWNKKWIIVCSDILRMIAVSTIAILLYINHVKLYQVFILTAFMGVISTLYRPAVRGIIPSIVDKQQLISANSLNSISQQISRMVGPVIGGIIITSVGIYSAYSINAMTFFVSALLVILLRLSGNQETNNTIKKQTSFLKEFIEGWNVLRNKPWLGASISIASLSNIGIASFDVIILPIFAKTVFNGVNSYGYFLSAMAIGSLLCATVIGRFGKIRKRGILYYSFMSLSGIFVFLLSFVSNFFIALALIVCIGFSLTAFIIIWDSATQELIDEHLLGRVVSFQMFGGLILLPLGYTVFGYLIDNYGTQISMSLAGISILLVSILGVTNKKIRTLN